MYEIVTPFEDKSRKTAVRNTQTGCLFYQIINYGIDGITIFRFEIELSGAGRLAGKLGQEIAPYQRRATELGVDHRKYNSAREFYANFGLEVAVTSLDLPWEKLDGDQITEVKREFLSFYNAGRNGRAPKVVIPIYLEFRPKQLDRSNWSTFPLDQEGRYHVWQ